jgi:hypothetical protein
MAYFDFFYNLILIAMMSRIILAKELAALSAPTRQDTLSPASGAVPREERLAQQGSSNVLG